jgi:hypothetical protein
MGKKRNASSLISELKRKTRKAYVILPIIKPMGLLC